MHKCLRHSIQPKAVCIHTWSPATAGSIPVSSIAMTIPLPSNSGFAVKNSSALVSRLGTKPWNGNGSKGVSIKLILYKIIYGQLMGNVSLQCACAKSVFAEKGWDCDGRKDIAEGIC